MSKLEPHPKYMPQTQSLFLVKGLPFGLDSRGILVISLIRGPALAETLAPPDVIDPRACPG